MSERYNGTAVYRNPDENIVVSKLSILSKLSKTNGIRNGQMDKKDKMVMQLFYNSHVEFFGRNHVLASNRSIE